MLHTVLSLCFVLLVIYGTEGLDLGVFPNRDIFVRPNESFSIVCFQNRENGMLHFYDDDEKIPEQFITRANSTFIEVTLSYPKPTRKQNFTCRRSLTSMVGKVNIFVDDDTSPVTDFNCVTRDLEILTCSFKPPTHAAPILYKANFALNGNFFKTRSPVSRIKIINNGRREFSSINLTHIHTNTADMSLNFLLVGDNSIKALTQEFNRTVLESLTPKKVHSVQIDNEYTTLHSVRVSFSLSKELYAISNKLNFEILLSDEYNKTYEKLDSSQLEFHDERILLALNDLNYANSKYSLRIRVKSVDSPDEETKWSEFVSFDFKTDSMKPEIVPDICDNCYNTLDNGNVMLYWTKVKKAFQNGDEFRYVVQVWNQRKLVINAETNETHFRLEAGSRSAQDPLKVLIFSKNERGISKKFAQISLPVVDDVQHALNIRKEIYDNEYKVTWGLLNDTNIKSYTLIWCSQLDDRQNQCVDAIEFRELPLNASTYSVKAAENLQYGFGLSANAKNHKTGFQWAKCTTAKSSDIGKVSMLRTETTAQHSIDIYWQLECADEAIVNAYNISYCMLSEETPRECEGEIKYEALVDIEFDKSSHYRITGLKSYRFYAVSIALMSATNHGQFVDERNVRTLEAVPTSPRNLELVEIGENSILLSWNRPEELNGEIMTYQLWANEMKIDINSDDSMNETFVYNLSTNLQHYTDYTITVLACNSNCSLPSESLHVRTKIGNPGRFLQPSFDKADGVLLVTWKAPARAVKGQNFYQMRVETLGRISTYRIVGEATSCIINLSDCIDDKIEVSLRSVNYNSDSKPQMRWKRSDKCFSNIEKTDIASNDDFHIGFWSPTMAYYCNSTEWYIIDLMVIAVLVLALLIAYLLFRWYKCYQQMKDIHVTWPKGFDPELFMSEASRTTTITSKHENLSNEICDIWRADSTIIKRKLTDVEEEEEEKSDEENESESIDKFDAVNTPIQIIDAKLFKDESLQPFIVNPITNEISFLMSKQMSSDNTKDKHVDGAGYMRMKSPDLIKPKICPNNEGYLDMTGKLPVDNQETLDTEELEGFLRDSQIINDGYIGKRRSGFMESLRKSKQLNEKEKKAIQSCCSINSNGYVGVNILRK